MLLIQESRPSTQLNEPQILICQATCMIIVMDIQIAQPLKLVWVDLFEVIY
jgi:hypothetical protein